MHEAQHVRPAAGTEGRGGAGRAFCPGYCPGSWGRDKESSLHPSSLATQRLAEGRAGVARAGAGLAAAEGGVGFLTDPCFWCGRGGQINSSVAGAFLRPGRGGVG